MKNDKLNLIISKIIKLNPKVSKGNKLNSIILKITN